MGVRFAAGTWNLGLGLLVLAYGYWLGLLPLAGAAVLFFAGYRMYQVAISSLQPDA